MIRCRLPAIPAIPAILACIAVPAAAADWDKGDGARLGFKGVYQGEAFEGVFQRFQPDIRFDADDLASAKFAVEIDLTSAHTGISDYDDTMQQSDFFDTGRFPRATFTTGGFRATGDGGFEADASLTIRNKTQALVFPFRFQRDDDSARLTATVTLNRLDYDVGIGDWADTSLLANPVEVTVDLPLLPKEASE